MPVRLGAWAGVVAMLDSQAWRTGADPKETALRALLAIAGHHPEAHPDLHSCAKVRTFLRAANTPRDALPGTVLDGVVRVVLATNRMVRAHRHRPFAGPLPHFRAARDHAGDRLTSTMWQPHASAVEDTDTDTRHAEMTGPEAVAVIAPVLSSRMAAADPRPA